MLVFVEANVTLTHRLLSSYKHLSIHSLQPSYHESVPYGSKQSGEKLSVWVRLCTVSQIVTGQDSH